MGVLVAGRKVSLGEPGIVLAGDVYVFTYRATDIRGFALDNLSSATLLVRFTGGQPNSSAQYNARVQGYEALAFPCASNEEAGQPVVYVYSTDPTAEFLFSAFSHEVNPAFKGNPATVPTAAAVKLEDRAVAGRYALVSAAGEVLVSGAVTATGTVDISDEAGRLLGIVSTSSVTPGNAAANLGKAEDAVHASGDTGVMALGVRNDAFAARSGADGDYTPIATDSAGRLGINGITPGSAAANLGKAEDAVHATGDVGVMALAVRNDADAARSGADGDYTPIAVDSAGRVKTLNPTGAAVSRSVALGAAAAADFWPANTKGGLLVNETGDVLYCRYSGAASAAAYDFSLADGERYEAPPVMPSSALSVFSTPGGQVRGYSF